MGLGSRRLSGGGGAGEQGADPRGGEAGLSRQPARDSTPSGSAARPAPPIAGRRFPSPFSRRELCSAIRQLRLLLESVPQHRMRRDGTGSARAGLVSRRAVLSVPPTPPAPGPPLPFLCYPAAADAAGDRTGKVWASEGTGVGASRAPLTKGEGSTARARLPSPPFPGAIILTGSGKGTSHPESGACTEKGEAELKPASLGVICVPASSAISVEPGRR